MKQRLLEALRSDEQLAARFLSTGNRRIIYMGPGRRDRASSPNGPASLGVSYDRESSSNRLVGDNAWGQFLTDVRRDFLRETMDRGFHINPVPDGMITVDYVPAGSEVSAVAALEQEGERFIHLDAYRGQRRIFDTARDGTTGHNRRDEGDGVSFHTFENPFGLTKNSLIRVHNAAEMSYYYEKALRDELDIKQLIDSLRGEGLMNITDNRRDEIVTELRSRFGWMRDTIASDPSLKDMRIVAESFDVPDNSLGRSFYDSVFAPSSAHVLARYIQNPKLLFVPSPSYVLDSLELGDHREDLRFSAVRKGSTVALAVFGSDTIGGRVLGSRTVSSTVNERVLGYGVNRTVSSRQVDFQMKGDGEVEKDYEGFAARLDEVLRSIGQDVNIRIYTDVNLGTARMVERYVREHGGLSYDFTMAESDGEGEVTQASDINPRKGNAPDGDSKVLSHVMIPNFASVFPVLIGKEESVEFRQKVGRDTKDFIFGSNEELGVDGVVCFSVTGDRGDYFLRRRAGLAAEKGIPVIRVIDNMSSDEQVSRLNAEALESLSRIEGELNYGESLFAGIRDRWDVGEPVPAVHSVRDMSMLGQELVDVVPTVVFERNRGVVYDQGQPYRSVFGLFLARLVYDVVDSPVDRAELRNRIEAAEGEPNRLQAIYESLPHNVEGYDTVEERALRSAVHSFAGVDSAFADILSSLPEGELHLVSTQGPRRLFVRPDGEGQNRFGIVFADERERVINARNVIRDNMIRMRDEEMARREREQVRYDAVKAEGQKVVESYPLSLTDAEGRPDAVWFGATNRPQGLMLEGDGKSYSAWDTEYGRDPMVREKVQRDPFFAEHVTLFPSDDQAVRGKRIPDNRASSYDLTGIRRAGKDGVEFPCTVGVPVKRNPEAWERDNEVGRPTSFKTDTDSSEFMNDLARADARARVLALRLGKSLASPVRVDAATGRIVPLLSRVFEDKVWMKRKAMDISEAGIMKMDRQQLKEVIAREKLKTVILTQRAVVRELGPDGTAEGSAVTDLGYDVPKELWALRKDVCEALDRKYGKGVDRTLPASVGLVPVDNPHGAPVNEALVARHQDILLQGMDYPLNFIALPKEDYTIPDGVSAEERRQLAVSFMADLNMTLAVMMNTAAGLGVPVRFPMDRNGLVDFGPGVPDELARMGRERIDSLIGVKNAEGLSDGVLEPVGRIDVSQFIPTVEDGKVFGSEIYLRPNDLASAFGPYDFTDIRNGITAPLHEIALCVGDGSTKVRLVDMKLTRGMNQSVNKFLRYEDNSERGFKIQCSDPSMLPKVKDLIQSYTARACRVKVESRLVSEKDVPISDEAPQSGYLEVLSSNSEELASLEYQYGARAVDSVTMANRFDGTDVENAYYGKVDARDGFRGWAQVRYTMPDGYQSGWTYIEDRALAYDVFMSSAMRMYGSDQYVPKSAREMEMLLRSYVIQADNVRFISAGSRQDSESLSDSKVVSLGYERNYDWHGDVDSHEPVQEHETPVSVQVAPEELPAESLLPSLSVVEHEGIWTREEAAAHPERLYVFTDNTDRDSGKNVIDRNSEYYRRYGDGTADLHFPTVTSAVLRGLDNAMPVSTQRWYHGLAKGENGRWQDADVAEFTATVKKEFKDIREKILSGGYSEVVFPQGGLFNGRISAISKERTPVLFDVLEKESKRFMMFVARQNGEIEKQNRGRTRRAAAVRNPSGTPTI